MEQTAKRSGSKIGDMREKGDGNAEEFPNQVEFRAASALLLLSTGILSLSSDHPDHNLTIKNCIGISLSDDLAKKKAESVESMLAINDTSSLKDYSSCLTNDGSSEAGVAAERLKFVYAAGESAKGFRRSRSKIIYRNRKCTPSTAISWGESSQYVTEAETDVITTEASCSSRCGAFPGEISSSRGRKSCKEKNNKRRGCSVEKKKRGLGSADSSNIRRRAEAILGFLSAGGCSSELRIRQVLGDSPDTSKALRMLLKLDEIRRRGAGGRSDPFIYEISLGTGELKHNHSST